MSGRRERTSGGSSRSTPNQSRRVFKEVLYTLRKPRFKTQADLAAALSGRKRKAKGAVTRGYVSALESGAKRPSLDLLRQLCMELVLRDNPAPTQTDLADLTELLFAALDLNVPPPYEALSPKDELKRQKEPWVRSIWIISETLGENRWDDFLASTVENLQRPDPVQYTYFVSNISEWQKCEDRLYQKLGNKIAMSVTAVQSPTVMCASRIRILNPGQEIQLKKCEGTITIGPLAHLALYRMQASQVEAICDQLHQVLRMMKPGRPVTTEQGKFTQLFPH